jgi:exodeoxyribonuclease-3
MKLVSFNVNGLRAALKKGLVDYLKEERADVVCIQESRCEPTDVDIDWPLRYKAFFNTAEKRGYSGTLILSKREPLSVKANLGVVEHDREGRVFCAEYADYYVVNVNVPNSKRDLSRLSYRQAWDRDFLKYLRRLEGKKPVIFCDDLNVAHTELDLTHPKANVKNHGFAPEERAGFEAPRRCYVEAAPPLSFATQDQQRVETIGTVRINCPSILIVESTENKSIAANRTPLAG